mgnify:CR=1 FL=1
MGRKGVGGWGTCTIRKSGEAEPTLEATAEASVAAAMATALIWAPVIVLGRRAGKEGGGDTSRKDVRPKHSVKQLQKPMLQRP